MAWQDRRLAGGAPWPTAAPEVIGADPSADLPTDPYDITKPPVWADPNVFLRGQQAAQKLPGANEPLQMKGLLWRMLGMDTPSWIKGLSTDSSPTSGVPPTQPSSTSVTNPVTPGKISLPTIPTTNTLNPGGANLTLPAIPEIPKPPMMPMPPPMTIPGGPGFGKAEKSLEEGRPKAPNTEELGKYNLSQVIGGMAKGAGGVSATEPGSFAKALAMAGAGGAEGRSSALSEGMKQQQEFEKQKQAYGLARAGQEIHMAIAQQAAAAQASQIAFNNAKSVWDTTNANALKTYEHELAVRGEKLPQVQANANGITIQTLDPNTREPKIQQINTKATQEHVEHMDKVCKALGGNSDYCQIGQASVISQAFKDNPVAAHSEMKRLAIKQVIDNGAGGSVFGPAWQKAYKLAESQVDPTGTSTLKTLKPVEYDKLVRDAAAAILLSSATDDSWIAKAAPHAVAAKFLLPREAPKAEPQATPGYN